MYKELTIDLMIAARKLAEVYYSYRAILCCLGYDFVGMCHCGVCPMPEQQRR